MPTIIDEILVNCIPGETRIALLSDGLLVDLQVSRDHRRSAIGNIYLGRVVSVVKGIQAAFVDIGLPQTAFLGLSDARPRGRETNRNDNISDFVTEGTALLVQVTKDAFGDKGPRATTHIGLPGHFAVYTPTSNRVSISRKIESKKDRDRLFQIFENQQQDDDGFIVRTAAASADEQALAADIASLRNRWEEIRKQRIKAKAPSLLFGDNDPLPNLLRDHATPALKQILIDSGEASSRARAFCEQEMPDIAGRVTHYRDTAPLFYQHDLEDQIDDALSARVALPQGGSLIIESAAAMTVIDVNSGGRSESGAERNALETNLTAAKEVARQLRLRNISGQIIVDFIAMRDSTTAGKVINALRQAVDPRTHVLGLTNLGLVEITRQRTTPSLDDLLNEDCDQCGTGSYLSAETMGFDVIRHLLSSTPKPKGLRVSPLIADELTGPLATYWNEAKSRAGTNCALSSDPDLEFDAIEEDF